MTQGHTGEKLGRNVKFASGFTLVELLVVIAIIAMLAALLFPVFVTARAAAFQMGGGRTAKGVYMASSLYASDYDDTFPLAMYNEPDGVRAWFGKFRGDGEEFDVEQGIISPYVKGKFQRDPTLVADLYFGDWAGMGYNWGVIGSDFHLTGNYSNWPNCANAASTSSLADPSKTVVFATSSYYSAPWSGGNGNKYLFGFFDPPSFWHGNPNVDYRHLGKTTVNEEEHEVISTGNAVMARADGSVVTRKQSETEDKDFWRQENPWQE